MTFNEFYDMVSITAAELPDELFNGLTGGVIAQPSVKLHEKSLPNSPLYVAGQYTRSGLGKQVILYYGSFMRLYGRLSDEEIKEQIRFVLLHELKHHWEFLAGERSLEEEDEAKIQDYLDLHSGSVPEMR